MTGTSVLNNSSTKFYIPSLDGIRAIAFLLVFFSHSGLGHIIPGGFGVTIFFFLSGYLITTLLRVEYEKTSRISLKNFYLRRTFRIFPPMYITLIIVICMSLLGVFTHDMQLIPVATQFFHFTNYYLALNGGEHMVPGTVIYWSLAVEEHFYIIFPLLLVLLINRVNYQSLATIFLIICGLILIWRCMLVFSYSAVDDYTYHASDTRFDSILYGCIMGVWSNPFLEKNSFLEQNDSYKNKLILLCVSVALLLFCFIYRNESFRETFRYSIQGASLFVIFYYTIRHSEWALFHWLNHSLIRWLGVLSYTLYLSHLVALRFARDILQTNNPNFISGILGFAIALIYAYLMFKLVEQPFTRLRRKYHRD